jgi:hypothetical protein
VSAEMAGINSSTGRIRVKILVRLTDTIIGDGLQRAIDVLPQEYQDGSYQPYIELPARIWETPATRRNPDPPRPTEREFKSAMDLLVADIMTQMRLGNAFRSDTALRALGAEIEPTREGAE